MNQNKQIIKDDGQYIYLIREREFIRLNELTYKIGKTKLQPNTFLSQYPQGSDLIGFNKVLDFDQAENKLIDIFKQKFKNRTEYGLEYFEGEWTEMLTEITIECNELNKIHKCEKTKIKMD